MGRTFAQKFLLGLQHKAETCRGSESLWAEEGRHPECRMAAKTAHRTPGCPLGARDSGLLHSPERRVMYAILGRKPRQPNLRLLHAALLTPTGRSTHGSGFLFFREETGSSDLLTGQGDQMRFLGRNVPRPWAPRAVISNCRDLILLAMTTGPADAGLRTRSFGRMTEGAHRARLDTSSQGVGLWASSLSATPRSHWAPLQACGHRLLRARSRVVGRPAESPPPDSQALCTLL